MQDEYGRRYVVLYVVTQVNKDGNRVLADAQQGRHTYATREEAERAIALWTPGQEAQDIDEEEVH